MEGPTRCQTSSVGRQLEAEAVAARDHPQVQERHLGNGRGGAPAERSEAALPDHRPPGARRDADRLEAAPVARDPSRDPRSSAPRSSTDLGGVALAAHAAPEHCAVELGPGLRERRSG